VHNDAFCSCTGSLVAPDHYVRPGKKVLETKLTAIDMPLPIGELTIAVQSNIVKTVHELRMALNRAVPYLPDQNDLPFPGIHQKPVDAR
jgi:hypothetical protein